MGMDRVVYKVEVLKWVGRRFKVLGGGFNKNNLGEYLLKLRVFFNIPRSHLLCERFTK